MVGMECLMQSFAYLHLVSPTNDHMLTNMRFDTVIIGAGPGGLAAAHKLSQCKDHSVLVIDSGERIRDHDLHPATGLGGAGLFSDGKFSFFPSATKIWSLPNVEEAYQWVAELLSSYRIQVPKFPCKKEIAENNIRFGLIKPYPSYYLNLEDRIRMIDYLSKKVQTMFNTTVSEISKLEGDPVANWIISCTSNEQESQFQILARHVIVATGRFNSFIKGRSITGRGFEYGVRMVYDQDNSFFNSHLTDPKIVFKLGEYEYRTFCCIRKGGKHLSFQNIPLKHFILPETVAIETSMGTFYSGRADVAPSSENNFGFLVRLPHDTDPIDFRGIDPNDHLIDTDFDGGILRRGLDHLITLFPELAEYKASRGP
jgi:hypothetical protein